MAEVVTRSPGFQRVTRTKLAVLGSPVGHSKSPQLHLAAYRVLGLPWTYDRVDVTGASLDTFMHGAGEDWRGLSLTMPLKHTVMPMLVGCDDIARLTRAANTILFSERGPVGFNTDVAGLIHPLRAAGVIHPANVLILGAGATAGSAITAACRLGAGAITVAARNLDRAAALNELAAVQGAKLDLLPLDAIGDVKADVVISTLPGSAADGLRFTEHQRQTSVLFDVIYDPWPSVIAQRWADAGGTVVPGIEMLLAQALRQVRIFVNGDPDTPVRLESEVTAAMRASVGRATEL